MKLFLCYLREHRHVLLMQIFFALIFFVVFFLYHLPWMAIFYPLLLCTLLGLVRMIVSFLRFRQTHLALCALQSKESALICELPPACSTEAADYQALVRQLQSELTELKNRDENRFRDTIEYYTLWVHQIKTPISSMHLTLQNEDCALSRQLSSDLFRIEQYVEMVLAYLRLDAGSGDYVFRRCSLDTLIRSSIRRFSMEFINRKLKIEYTPVSDYLITDEKWLSFVLDQLLSNALKYTRKGSIRIYKKDPFCLCIEDTGIGIAPQDLPRIFEKGYTGCNGRTNQASSGIGLYLCKRICDNLGIGISVSSVPDQGTAVCLDLTQYPLSSE